MREHDWMPPTTESSVYGIGTFYRCARCRAERRVWMDRLDGFDSDRLMFDGALVDDLNEDPGCDPDARVCPTCGLAVIRVGEDGCINCLDRYDEANEADVA